MPDWSSDNRYYGPRFNDPATLEPDLKSGRCWRVLALLPTPQKINLLVSLMMSFVMSLFFSGFFTFIAFGWTAQWASSWAHGFAIGWPLGFLLALVIGAPIRKIAVRLSGLPK